MPTDIERLHKAINDPLTWSGRNTGKTTIMIHNLAGTIQTTKKGRIAVLIAKYRSMDYLENMIRQIFEEQKIDILKVEKRMDWLVKFKEKEIWLMFIPYRDAGRRLQGLDCPYANLDDEN